MRKNKITGAIPGSGRKKKEYVKKTFNLSEDAVNVLNKLKFGEAGEFVSNAIIFYAPYILDLGSNTILQHISGITGTFIKTCQPTGKELTTQIMTPKGIYFAPSHEFKILN